MCTSAEWRAVCGSHREAQTRPLILTSTLVCVIYLQSFYAGFFFIIRDFIPMCCLHTAGLELLPYFKATTQYKQDPDKSLKTLDWIFRQLLEALWQLFLHKELLFCSPLQTLTSEGGWGRDHYIQSWMLSLPFAHCLEGVFKSNSWQKSWNKLWVKLSVVQSTPFCPI